jgi:hypothetical protein
LKFDISVGVERVSNPEGFVAKLLMGCS